MNGTNVEEKAKKQAEDAVMELMTQDEANGEEHDYAEYYNAVYEGTLEQLQADTSTNVDADVDADMDASTTGSNHSKHKNKLIFKNSSFKS